MTQNSRNEAGNRSLYMIIFAVVLVVLAVIGIVMFQSTTNAAEIDYSGIPQERLDDGGFVLGNPDARVTVVAFEDFLCPHCQSYQTTVHQFIDQYVKTGQARFEYRGLPAVHPTFSAVAFNLAECTAEEFEGSFWDAHDTLFNLASTRRFDNNTPRLFAEEMGINYSELLECVPNADQLQVDGALAQEIGVSGTPTVGIRIDGGPINLGMVSQQASITELGAIVLRFQ